MININNLPVGKLVLAGSFLLLAACGGGASDEKAPTNKATEITISCSPTSLELEYPGATESISCTAEWWDEEINDYRPVAPTEQQKASGIGVIQYSMLNPSVAGVDDFGVVTPKGVGSTNLNISVTYNGEPGSTVIPVTIEEGVAPMLLDCGVDEVSLLYPGSAQQLECIPKLLNESTGTYDDFTPSDQQIAAGLYELSFKVAQPGVAIVGSSGIISPAGAGSTSITARATYDGFTATDVITVNIEEYDSKYLLSCINPRMVLLSSDFTNKPANKSIECTVYERNEDTEEYELFIPESVDQRTMEYEIEDTSIATVNEDGLIKAINSGNTTITVTFSADGGSISETLVIISKFSDVSRLVAKPSSIWVGIGTKKRIEVTSVDGDGQITNNGECNMQAYFNNNVSVELDESISTNGVKVFNVTGISKGYSLTSQYALGGYFSCTDDGPQSQEVRIQVKEPVDIPNPIGINNLGKNPDIAVVDDRVFITSYSDDEEKLVFTKISGTISSETIAVTSAAESGIASGILMDILDETITLLSVSSRNLYAMLDQIKFMNTGDFNTGSYTTDILDDNLSNYYPSYDNNALLEIDSKLLTDATSSGRYIHSAIIATSDSGLVLYEQGYDQSYPTKRGTILSDTRIVDAAISIIPDCGEQRISVAICSKDNGLLYGIESGDGTRIEFYDMQSDCEKVDISIGSDKQVSLITQTGNSSEGEELVSFQMSESNVYTRVIDTLPDNQEYLDFDLDINQDLDTPRVIAIIDDSTGNHLVHYTEYESYDGNTSEWTRDEIDTGYDVGESLAMLITTDGTANMVVEGSEGILKYMTQPSFIDYDVDESRLAEQTCTGIIPTRKTAVNTYSFE